MICRAVNPLGALLFCAAMFLATVPVCWAVALAIEWCFGAPLDEAVTNATYSAVFYGPWCALLALGLWALLEDQYCEGSDVPRVWLQRSLWCALPWAVVHVAFRLMTGEREVPVHERGLIGLMIFVGIAGSIGVVYLLVRFARYVLTPTARGGEDLMPGIDEIRNRELG